MSNDEEMMNPESFNKKNQDNLPGLFGIQVLGVGNGRLVAKLDVTRKHVAINGNLHAGSVTSLADSSAGYCCIANLPKNATSFTTIELKYNLLGTVSPRARKLGCVMYSFGSHNTDFGLRGDLRGLEKDTGKV